MTDKLFCYHCRRYHPSDEVAQVQSNGIKRWRCKQSIAASQTSREQRDAFGKSVTERNKQVFGPRGVHLLPHCVLDLFGGVAGSEGLA